MNRPGISCIFNRAFCFAVFLCTSLTAICQQQNTTTVSRNTLYAGFDSKDLYYSVNYDHIFHTNGKLSYSYRIGVSVLKDAFAVPLGIHLFTGAGSSHAEFSFTLIPYVDHSASFLGSNDKSDKYLYVEPGIGYRYQQPGGGLFLRAAVTPILFLDPPSDDFWNMDPKIYAGGNIGIGYTFRGKGK